MDIKVVESTTKVGNFEQITTIIYFIPYGRKLLSLPQR